MFFSLLSTVVISIMTKSNLGKKGFISSYTLQYIIKGSKYRDMETETESEAMEKYCLHSLVNLLIYNPGPPAQGWHLPQ